MTRPFCSHGVTTISWAMWTRGSVVDDRRTAGASWRASRSSTLTSVAAASKAGRKPGRMKPPSLLPAKPTPGSVAASMSAGVRHLGVAATATPWPCDQVARPAGWRRHRQGDAVAEQAGRAPASRSASRRLGVGEHVALVVDEGQVLAVGVEHRPEVRRPTARTSVGHVGRRGRRGRTRMTPAVEAYGLTASTSAPSLASTFGMTNDVEP